MVNLVAMIFLMVNGAPSEQPVRSYTYNQTFETVESCLAFGKTEEGLVLTHAVNEYVMSQRGTIMARIGCVEAEDNSI
jgi:hypothetical protein